MCIRDSHIVLRQGLTEINGPHQGGLVELENGESWFIHFQDLEVIGRISHLQPVQWIDGWPVMGENIDTGLCGQPVMRHKKPNVGKEYPVSTIPTSDDFSSDKLGLQWQWQANPKEEWYSLTENKGSPVSYTHLDVYKRQGSATMPGSYSYHDGQYTVKSSGLIGAGNEFNVMDLDPKTDDFSFMYKEADTNSVISTRIDSVSKLNNNCVSGIMFRDELTNTSDFVMLNYEHEKGGAGLGFVYRLNGEFNKQFLRLAELPRYVKLVKRCV